MSRPTIIRTRRRRFGLFVALVVTIAIALLSVLNWSTLHFECFYENWSAEDFGDDSVLTRRKLHFLLPGPEYIELKVSKEQFQELAQDCLGSAIGCVTIRTNDMR